jgi:predicted AlkP superfamily pyrophosphatase or phosphodiesterase
MTSSPRLRCLLRLSAFLILSLPALAETPRLVLAILVDQLRSDYLERFHDHFGEGGFRRLCDKGTFLTQAHYNYSPTVTAPGHASFLSGCPPSVHGIIGNDWFDKATRKTVYCCSDDSVQGVGTEADAGKMSPHQFVGSNLADEMRLRFQSKVVGLSMKDRGAIFPAGKQPSGAYWFESSSGKFITSTYYRAELPEWIHRFNDREVPKSYVGRTWDRLLEPAKYVWADAAAGEGTLPGETEPVFPHRIQLSPKGGYEHIISSPFANELLAELAKAAIEGENLGEGPQPDLLTVSFSAIDYIGHRFGPYSQEAQDITLRLDRQLADLFAYIDKKIGLSRTWIVLTADHGVAPTPEFARQLGLPGERVDEIALMKDLLFKLEERFGEGAYLLHRRLNDGQLYFNHDTLRKKNIAPAQLASFIREWALSSGFFQEAFDREQLLNGQTGSAIGRMVLNGYSAERGGDLVLILKPYRIFSGVPSGTTHGSPYHYDSHVPVLFHGKAFQPGRHADEFWITDIVPTLSAALHMNTPAGCIGKPLTKLLTNP